MNKKINIPAVHDDDIRNILNRFDMAEKIDKGEVLCCNCTSKITWDNLSAFKIKDDSLICFCDNLECIESINK